MFKADLKCRLSHHDEIAIRELGGYWLRARLMPDENGDQPDNAQDGFWPSLEPKDPGYIGPKSLSTLRRHTARAQEVMRQWEAGDWWWAGVVVEVCRSDNPFEPLEVLGSASLWGIEVNYPTFKKGRPYDNSYLLTVANELIEDALLDAGVPRLVAKVLIVREEHAHG